MNTLLLTRLLLDFGLLILIWLVQLVIYPSFKYYTHSNLIEWHQLYTTRISYVVMPLMLGQLSLSIIQLWQGISLYTLLSMGIIVLLWLSTFLQFVPLHNNIGGSNFDATTIIELVNKNWIRTFLWTVLFCLTLWQSRFALQ